MHAIRKTLSYSIGIIFTNNENKDLDLIQTLNNLMIGANIVSNTPHVTADPFKSQQLIYLNALQWSV